LSSGVGSARRRLWTNATPQVSYYRA
jgi:hypothetical protein